MTMKVQERFPKAYENKNFILSVIPWKCMTEGRGSNPGNLHLPYVQQYGNFATRILKGEFPENMTDDETLGTIVAAASKIRDEWPMYEDPNFGRILPKGKENKEERRQRRLNHRTRLRNYASWGQALAIDYQIPLIAILPIPPEENTKGKGDQVVDELVQLALSVKQYVG